VFNFFRTLDRRWVFLSMLLAVAIPILTGLQFPETASSLSRAVFDEVAKLKPGDKVLFSFDFEPSTEGELGPMAVDLLHQCCEKKLKIYFMALVPVGPTLIEDEIRRVIQTDYPDMVYGQDYVNLGYKSGNEGVIKVIITELRGLYTTDARGTNIDQIPMCRGVQNLQAMNLLISITAGYPGLKEWVQYAATPYRLPIVGGCTGVGAPQLFPYIPNQLPGLLAGIKGASEYESLVNQNYSTEIFDPKFHEANRRMGPQLVAHLLMIGLIVGGNIIFFVQRHRERQSQ
jgi:hypothetical protein